MGMEHVVRFPQGALPSLQAVLAQLAERRYPAKVRMVDGELTAPGEALPDRWREVRLGTPGGMITVARRDEEVAVITWGNADDAMRRAWNAVAWAVAVTGTGQILNPAGPVGPEAFLASAPLPPEITRE